MYISRCIRQIDLSNFWDLSNSFISGKKSKTKYGCDDKLNEWMSSIQVDRLDENDRKLLDKIKTRLTLFILQYVEDLKK